jgi:alpha-L-fucosidase
MPKPLDIGTINLIRWAHEAGELKDAIANVKANGFDPEHLAEVMKELGYVVPVE